MMHSLSKEEQEAIKEQFNTKGDIDYNPGEVSDLDHTPKKKTERKDTKESSETKIDEQRKPSIHAFVKNQITRYPKTVTENRVFARVLDLSNEGHVDEYSKIRTNHESLDHGWNIISERVEFSPDTNNWKVLLIIKEFVFLPLIGVQKEN